MYLITALNEIQVLMTIPGVSNYTALTTYPELGGIDRVDGDKYVISYVRLNRASRNVDQDARNGCPSKQQIPQFIPVTTSI